MIFKNNAIATILAGDCIESMKTLPPLVGQLLHHFAALFWLTRPGDVILDPFGGSGTTGGVALKHGRHAILCELNPEYIGVMQSRIESIL